MEAQIKLTREEHTEALRQYLIKIGAIGPMAQIKSGSVTEANVHVVFNAQPPYETNFVKRGDD